MKKSLTLFPLLSVTLLISPMLKATDFTFQPRAITGIMFHKYDGILYETSAYMPFIGTGATLSYDRFFVDAYVQKSGDGEDGDITLTREDYAIAFGYAVTDSLSISAGYREGSTDIDTLNDSSFTTNGFFVGAAYGWLIGDGLLGLNLAFTRLETDYELNLGKPLTLDADPSIGTTLGVHWKAPITKQLSYGASLDYYNYSFESKNKDIIDNDAFNNEIDESFLTLRASLSYRF